MLSEMVENFENESRGIVPALDYMHESQNIAAGWFKKLFIKASENGHELWAQIEMTPNGAKVLSDKEFGYVSADFDTEYQDNETGEKHGCVLLGAGLTNRPVIKRMASAISLSEKESMKTEKKLGGPGSGPQGGGGGGAAPLGSKESRLARREAARARSRARAVAFNKKSNAIKQGQSTRKANDAQHAFTKANQQSRKSASKKLDERNEPMTLEQALEEIKKLQAKIAELESDNAALSEGDDETPAETVAELAQAKSDLDTKEKELSEVKGKLTEAQKALVEKNKALELAEKESDFTKQLAEGKVVEAQREAFIKGDMKEFVAKAVPIKLSEQGSGKAPAENVTTESKAEDEILSLAKTLSESEKIPMSKAIARVIKENKQLAEKANY